MGLHLITILYTEETLFSLLIQFQKRLIFLVDVLHNWVVFFREIFKTAKDSQMFQTSDFVARMDILNGKLEVCLPVTQHHL